MASVLVMYVGGYSNVKGHCQEISDLYYSMYLLPPRAPDKLISAIMNFILKNEKIS